MLDPDSRDLRLALPKGRMQEAVSALLADAGIHLRHGPRGYRPAIDLEGFEVKLLKPQNIVEMLHVGSRDLGFAGADWVAELRADVVLLLDTGLDPVRLVAAMPRENLGRFEDLAAGRRDDSKTFVVASEYERLTREWIERRGLAARFVRSFGATEVFPPEDADCIVDNTATGATLEANGLAVVDELMRSSTGLYANPRALEQTARRERIEHLVMLLDSVLQARRRVLLELNVERGRLEEIVEVLPCMREPTIAPLHGTGGFAVRAAVPRADLPRLIPELKARGGTDLVVTEPAQIVP